MDQIVKGADIVIATTDSSKINSLVVEAGRRVKALVYAADNPFVSDFSFPAVGEIGGVRIAVSTNGKSPLLAKMIRDKLLKSISKEDILHVELQNYCRKLAKALIPDYESRREKLIRIAHDERIRRLILENKLDDAKRIAEDILRGRDEAH